MRIVIDIPEKTVNEIKDNAMFAGTIPSEILWDVTSALVNGTPLPKGQGRLVDMSEVIVKLMQYFGGNKTIGQCLDEVHTVIEADGGDAE